MNKQDLIKLSRVQAALEAIAGRAKDVLDTNTLRRAAHDIEFVILKNMEKKDVAV